MTETLWDFAVACYRRDGVADHCLRLQDSAGVDVNMLLTAAWLAAQERRWQPARVHELIALCADWRTHCILPLRAIRRYLKEQVETPALYSSTKALELEAERHQLHLLHAALQPLELRSDNAADADALALNLQAYFDCIDKDHSTIGAADRHALLEALRRQQ